MAVNQRNRVNVGYGLSQALSDIFPSPIVALRNPTTADINYPLGMIWVNDDNDSAFILTSVFAGAAKWGEISTGAPGTVSSVTGTAAQITAAPTVGNVVLTLPAAVTAPGSLTTTTSLASGTTLTAGTGLTVTTGNAVVTAGNITATAGNIVATAGNITATAGNIAATAGSVSAGTTVTAGTGLVATTGGVSSVGNSSFTGGTFGAGTDAAGDAINIGTGAHSRTITIGSSTTGNVTDLNSAITAIGGTGLTSVNANLPSPVASPTASVVSNFNVGQATFTGFTTAAAASQVFTITNAIVTTASVLLVTAANFGSNDAKMTVSRIVPAAGSFAVTLVNNGAEALNGNVQINWWVLQA